MYHELRKRGTRVPHVLIIARSILFNVLFYFTILIYLAVALPTFLMPYWAIVELAKVWARTNLWLLRTICRIDVEFAGLNKIPPGPLTVAAKHQSFWETFALLLVFSRPTYIVKRELMWIPLFGWFMWKGRMVPVDRGARRQALTAMTRRAREELRRGRQIIIFPEGTRRQPGAPPAYKSGIAHLYAETGVPCVPVALNSGLYWGRRSFKRYPGTIRVEILDPIPPGLDKNTFLQRLEHDIETATARLVAAAAPPQAEPQGSG
ncbi:MAG: lysophospholipid acyltransferase family protein [Xanthobacteraceae bacterium]